jgi:hypothetical protein
MRRYRLIKKSGDWDHALGTASARCVCLRTHSSPNRTRPSRLKVSQMRSGSASASWIREYPFVSFFSSRVKLTLGPWYYVLSQSECFRPLPKKPPEMD